MKEILITLVGVSIDLCISHFVESRGLQPGSTVPLHIYVACVITGTNIIRVLGVSLVRL